MSPRFAFLTYVARSGSTLLARLIASRCPTVRVLPEFQLPDILLQFGERYVEGLDADGLLRLLALDPQLSGIGVSPDRQKVIARESAGSGIRSLLERVLREAEPSRVQSPDLVLLKKGSLIEHLPRLTNVFPEARLLHIVRDPRGVANSMMRSRDPYLRREPLGRGDPYFIGRYWSHFQKRVSEARALGALPLTEVRYEALLRDPAEVVDRIADSMGVPASTGNGPGALSLAAAERDLHALVVQPPRSERASAWQFELPFWQGATVEYAAEAMRGVCGYPRHYLAQRTRTKVAVAIARGLAFHAIQSTRHLLGAVPFYLAHPERLRLRARRVLSSLDV